MTSIKNVSPYGDLDVPLLGRVVAAGEVVDVDEDHAKILLDQAENFVAYTEPAPEPAPAPVPESPAAPANPETEQS